MKWQVFALVLALFVSSAIAPAFAKEIEVPGDSNGDKIVSADEVAAAEKLANDGKLSTDELQEIKAYSRKYSDQHYPIRPTGRLQYTSRWRG